MPNNRFYGPLHIPLRHPRWVSWMGYAISAVAVICTVLAGLDIWLRGGLLLSLGAYCRYWQHRQSRMRNWQTLSRDGSGSWWLHTITGKQVTLRGCHSSYLSSHLIIVVGRSRQKPVYLLLWGYQYSADDYRRLAMYLRLQN